MLPKKHRWYRISFNGSFSSLCHSMTSFPYTEISTCGFDLAETNKSTLRSRFIEKKIVPEETLDPFGKKEVIYLVKYIIFYFEIIQVSKNIAIIKIISPPASLRTFVSALSNVCGLGFSIEKITFNLSNAYDYFIKNKTIDRIIVKRLCVSELPFSSHTIAKIELVSSEDSYADLKNKYKDGCYKLDKLSIDARVGGVSESVEISSMGLTIYTQGFDSILENYVIGLPERARSF